jgi:hypothetical protein
LNKSLPQRQTNYQAAVKTAADDEQAVFVAETKSTNLLLTLQSLNFGAKNAFDAQTNAANAAQKLEQASTEAKLARALSTNGIGGPANDSVQFQDNYEFRYIKLARLLWLNSLSGEDVVSVGMAQSDNPQQFRKLVFWARSTVGNLDALSSDVDNVVQQVTTIGDSYKQIGQQQQASAAAAKTNQTARAAAAKKALTGLVSGNTNSTVEGIVDLLVPAATNATSQTIQTNQ